MTSKPSVMMRRLAAHAALAAFGLVLAALLGELGLGIAGWAERDILKDNARSRVEGPGRYRILCLGESTTAPEPGGDGQSWPRFLEETLNRDRPNGFRVINMGRPGVTTAFIVASLEGYLEAYRPDVVVTMMGVNDDQYFGVALDDSGLLAKLLWRSRVWRVFRWISATIEARLRSAVVPAAFPESPCRRLASPTEDGGRPAGFERTCWKDLHRTPDDYYPAYVLGAHDKQIGRNRAAEPLLRLAYLKHPDSIDPYFDYADVLTLLGRREEASGIFEEAIRLFPDPGPGLVTAHIRLANLYARSGRKKEAEAQYLAAIEMKTEWTNLRGPMRVVEAPFSERSDGTLLPATVANYQKLRDVLRARGIPLVAMQYPTEDLKPLADALGPGPGIYYVENQKQFREALSRMPFDKIFLDRFRPGWGHSTAIGNRLIAGNLVPLILRIIEERERRP